MAPAITRHQKPAASPARLKDAARRNGAVMRAGEGVLADELHVRSGQIPLRRDQIG
jgi:hypothetical protein